MKRSSLFLILACLNLVFACGVRIGNPGVPTGAGTGGSNLTVQIEMETENTVNDEVVLYVDEVWLKLGDTIEKISLKENLELRSDQNVVVLNDQNVIKSKYDGVQLVLRTESPARYRAADNNTYDLALAPFSQYQDNKGLFRFLQSDEDDRILIDIAFGDKGIELGEGKAKKFAYRIDVADKIVPFAQLDQKIKDYFESSGTSYQYGFEPQIDSKDVTVSNAGKSEVQLDVDLENADKACVFAQNAAVDSSCSKAIAKVESHLTRNNDIYLDPGIYKIVVFDQNGTSISEYDFQLGDQQKIEIDFQSTGTVNINIDSL